MNEKQIFALARALDMAMSAFGIAAFSVALLGCACLFLGITGMFIGSSWGAHAIVVAAYSAGTAAVAATVSALLSVALFRVEDVADVVVYREYTKSLYVLDRARHLERVWLAATSLMVVLSFFTLWAVPLLVLSGVRCLCHFIVEHTMMRMYEDTSCNEVSVERVFG